LTRVEASDILPRLKIVGFLLERVVKDGMPLSQRVYRCEFCGFEADRDLNAALNLKAVAVSSPETLNACMSGRKTSPLMERTAIIQEPNTIGEMS